MTIVVDWGVKHQNKQNYGLFRLCELISSDYIDVISLLIWIHFINGKSDLRTFLCRLRSMVNT